MGKGAEGDLRGAEEGKVVEVRVGKGGGLAQRSPRQTQEQHIILRLLEKDLFGTC